MQPNPNAPPALVAVPPPLPSAFPSGLALTPPNLPGLTNSVPVNLATGATVIGGTNALTSQVGGSQISLPANLIGILWHVLFPGQKMGRLQHVLLIVVCLAIGLTLFLVIGHLDLVEAITRSCGLAVQGWGTNFGLKVGGVDALNGEVKPNA